MIITFSFALKQLAKSSVLILPNLSAFFVSKLTIPIKYEGFSSLENRQSFTKLILSTNWDINLSKSKPDLISQIIVWHGGIIFPLKFL